MSEEEIMKELEAEAEKLYAGVEERIEPMIAFEPELAEAMKEVYGEQPQLVQVLGIAAAASGTASYALVDYSFTSNVRTLWAYAGGRWRHRPITDAQVAGIAEVVMKADRLDVWWSNSRINFARCWKKF
ncbi:MAG: hypothetical protein PVJ38_02030 [Candidatus Bathyarchaeota archaeon]|jgi:hypothetical protein